MMDRCLKRLSQHDDRLTAATQLVGKAQIRSSGPCDSIVQVGARCSEHGRRGQSLIKFMIVPPSALQRKQL